MEAAVNARIADRLVWDGIARLMTSPEQMQNQIRRWMDSQHKRTDVSGVDIGFLKNEIAKLKEREDRYNKAYGSGTFTLEQLKEYTVPVREKVASYESKILKSEQEKRELQTTLLPDEKEVATFAKEASEALMDLNFTAKKAIVANVVERVVGTKDKLQIYGFIPVTTETNVNVFTNDRNEGDIPPQKFVPILKNINVQTIHRHRQDTPRHGFGENSPKLIPFRFDVDIPLLTVSHRQN
jgi:site-specific DNA recombinase